MPAWQLLPNLGRRRRERIVRVVRRGILNPPPSPGQPLQIPTSLRRYFAQMTSSVGTDGVSGVQFSDYLGWMYLDWKDKSRRDGPDRGIETTIWVTKKVVGDGFVGTTRCMSSQSSNSRPPFGMARFVCVKNGRSGGLPTIYNQVATLGINCKLRDLPQGL